MLIVFLEYFVLIAEFINKYCIIGVENKLDTVLLVVRKLRISLYQQIGDNNDPWK